MAKADNTTPHTARRKTQHGLQGRLAKTTRDVALGVVIPVGLAAVVLSFFDWGWAGILAVTAAGVGVAIYASARGGAGLTRDFNALADTMRDFLDGMRGRDRDWQGRSGNIQARARSSVVSEARQLALLFNKIADRTQKAIEEIEAEDHRESHFISDVSHELKTPLTAIRGTAETLLEGDVPDEDQLRFLNRIIAESERLSRLANDLITLQAIEGGTGEIRIGSVDLSVAVERAAESLAPLIELRGVHFEVRGQGATVWGDIDRIQQIIVNLVDNATRVVDEGGRVWIEFDVVGRDSLGPLIQERLLETIDTFAVLTVNDNGPGIPENELDRLFDRFYRRQFGRDRRTGGSGLGLSIVKAIVRQHGGAITVTNRDAGGACFSVYLPIMPEPDIDRLAPPPEPSGRHPQGRVRYLQRRQRKSPSEG